MWSDIPAFVYIVWSCGPAYMHFILRSRFCIYCVVVWSNLHESSALIAWSDKPASAHITGSCSHLSLPLIISRDSIAANLNNHYASGNSTDTVFFQLITNNTSLQDWSCSAKVIEWIGWTNQVVCVSVYNAKALMVTKPVSQIRYGGWVNKDMIRHHTNYYGLIYQSIQSIPVQYPYA